MTAILKVELPLQREDDARNVGAVRAAAHNQQRQVLR